MSQANDAYGAIVIPSRATPIAARVRALYFSDTSAETGRVMRRFTRLEVPRSPIVAGVWVHAEPARAEPFSVELVRMDAGDNLVE